MSVVVCLACITAKSNRLPERVLNFLFLLAAVLPLMWVWMWAFGLDPDYSFLTPFWYSWFLMSMAWWMITVPFIERFPRTMLVASLGVRSEEHTSELQSRGHLVCRLLLAKDKSKL